MLFEILRNDKVMMQTKDEDCIPPPDVLRAMKDAGYTFRKDGKVFKPTKSSDVKVSKK